MGFPSPAKDYAEERISLDALYMPHPDSIYFMRMEKENYSMVNAFISPGSLLVIDKSLTPKNMDIVIAYVNGEFMTRYLKKNDVKAWLEPANPKMREIPITKDLQIEIWGVVVAIITEPKNLSHVRVG